MNLQILIVAPPPKMKKGKLREPRLRLKEAKNEVAFRRNEILSLAFSRKYKATLLPKTHEHVEVEMIDGRRKKCKLQYFNSARTVSCCSCEDFVLDESRFCVHLAAVENFMTQPVHYQKYQAGYRKWCNVFRIRLRSTPKYYKRKYNFWDPFKGRAVYVGKKLPEIKTVSTLTHDRLNRRRKAKKIKLPKPNDAGLLKGVQLYDYQQEIFTKMLIAQRAICSIIMGGGKTLTTIACYAFIKKHTATRANPVTMLIVAPKSLRYQWGDEIKRTCGDDVYQLEKKANLLKAANHDIVVVTYQFLTRHFAVLTKRKWTIAVVDEIQFIRNNKTKAWKALSKIKANFIYGLSGTVIENRLGDLYSIMEIIQPGALGPLWKFNMEFQNLQIRSKAKLIYGGFKNLPALKEKLKDYVFSYDKLNLAPIQHHVTSVGMTKMQRTVHDEYRQKARELIAKSLNGSISHYERMLVQSYLLKARQACNSHELLSKKREQPSAKIIAFLDLVDRVCVQSNEKLVVFSDWVEMLEICKRHILTRYQLGITMFTGKQSSKQRIAAVKSFQSDPKTMIFLASDAGGLGLDGLQLASSNVAHTDIPWNPAKIDQRNGRLHRILQTTGVHVYYFVAKDTIEEHVHTLAKDKRNTRLKTLAEFAI